MTCTRPDCPVCLANAPKRQDDGRWTVGEASKDGLSVAFDSPLPSDAWIEPLCALATFTVIAPTDAQSLRDGSAPIESPKPLDTMNLDLQQPREFPAPYTTPEIHVHHYCPGCQASKPGWHVHGDPLEDLVWGELLEKCRELIATAPKEPKP